MNTEQAALEKTKKGRMVLLAITWESFLWLAWGMWWGGLSFYAIVIVPIGTVQIGSVDQGFITQKVTMWHNVITILFVLALSIDAYFQKKRGAWIVVVLLASITIALVIAHSMLSSQMNFQEKSVPSHFYSKHAIYLWITAAEWFVGMFVPLFFRPKKCGPGLGAMPRRKPCTELDSYS